MATRVQTTDPSAKPAEPDPRRSSFARQVQDALARLYDPVHLQTHPLARALRDKAILSGPNLGQALRQEMLAAITSLAPQTQHGDPDALRGHLILTLRYVEAADIAEVQRRLTIGRSQFYREHRRALAALVSLLQERWAIDDPTLKPPGTGAPLQTPPAPPATDLPLALTSFVGRQRELAEVRRLLQDTRLLTLTGSGGCGKTRLALQALAEARHAYQDGARIVQLATVSDPGLLPQTVALALGVSEERKRPIHVTLANYLRSKQLLLLLDNCEHLLPACAQLLETLLRECPHLRVLVTSREALGIGGETRWRVPSLDTPPPERWGDGAEQTGGYEAVQLFVERARAVRPDFSLTTDNAPAVAEVCWRLDGIPLAIELAAARVRVLAVAQIAQRLDDRFRLLTDGSRTALPRHQTLRATIDWSHDLLDPRARVLFRRLAVFAGGWTLEAAEAMCAGWPAETENDAATRENVLDLLSQLVDRSLVAADEFEGTARYRFLETIRQYALEKLRQAGEEEEARRRHRDWFVAYAERELPNMVGREQQCCLRRLEAERDNLREALAWSQHDPAGADAELRLVAALARYWRWMGRWKQSAAWLDEAMARCEPVASAARARALTCRGHMEVSYSGDLDLAVALTEEAVTVARSVGDLRLLAFVLRQAAVVLAVRDDREKADCYFREGIAVASQVGDQREMCSAQAQRLIFCHYPTYPETAVRDLEAILAVASILGDATLLTEIYCWLGLVFTAKEEYERARAALVESAAWARSLGYWEFLTACTGMLGDIALVSGDRAGALLHYREALVAGLDRASDGWTVEALLRLAALAAEAGLYEAAARLFAWSDGRQVTVSSNRWYRGADTPGLREMKAAHERALAGAREALGEEAFTRAWEAGHAMTPDEAGELGKAVLAALRAPPLPT